LKNKTRVLIGGALLLLFLCQGCNQSQLNNTNNPIRIRAVTLFQSYQNALNKGNRSQLAEIMSDSYQGLYQNKANFIKNIMTETVYYDRFSIKDLKVLADELQASVELVGSTVYFPEYSFSILKNNFPLIDGYTIERSIFRIKQSGANPEIDMISRVSLLKNFIYGKYPPKIIDFYPTELVAKMGMPMEVFYKVKKSNNQKTLLIVINDKLVESSSLDAISQKEGRVILSLPVTLKKGDLFEVTLSVIQGEMSVSGKTLFTPENMTIRKIYIPVK